MWDHFRTVKKQTLEVLIGILPQSGIAVLGVLPEAKNNNYWEYSQNLCGSGPKHIAESNLIKNKIPVLGLTLLNAQSSLAFGCFCGVELQIVEVSTRHNTQQIGSNAQPF